MIFIVQRKVIEGADYCLAWAFASREELFKFFHENCHDQLEHGLAREGMFHVQSDTEEYRVSVAQRPFYMNWE